jgi:hypothetical protein
MGGAVLPTAEESTNISATVEKSRSINVNILVILPSNISLGRRISYKQYPVYVQNSESGRTRDREGTGIGSKFGRGRGVD